jgi:zinc protease
VFNQARELGSNWVEGFPLDMGEQLIAKLRQVTAAQVQSVALRYFGDDQLTVATLRPQPLDPNRKKRPPSPVSNELQH